MERYQTGDTASITGLFLDQGGTELTGLTALIDIWRVSDGQYWTGAAYQATNPGLGAAEVSAGNLPGWYQYDFITTLASEEEHAFKMHEASGAAKNAPLVGALVVGGFIDNLDAAILPIAEALVGRIEIDITTDPWRENHYDLATRTSIVRAFDLFDQAGVAIAGDDSSGNNPLNDSDVIVARKVLV